MTLGNEKGNGEKFNRAIRASEAYAALQASLAEQNLLLFGSEEKKFKGWLPDIKDSLDSLHRNPFVRLGLAVDSIAKLALVVVGFFGSIAATVVAIRQIGSWTGWW